MIKKEVWRGQDSLRFIYFRYKDSPYFSLLILSVSFLGCIILIFQAIIPQAQSWFSIRNEEEATRRKIAIIRGNANLMLNLNKNVLEGNRQLAIHALPVEKDFGAIINAVVTAAARSGVSIDDFSFSLGLVSSPSAQSKINPEANDPRVGLFLYLTGGIDRVKSFISEISEKLPLSEIEKMDVNKEGMYVALYFYSKSYVLPRVSLDEPIRPLTPENNRVFSNLSKWQADSFYGENDQGQTPPSAVPLF